MKRKKTIFLKSFPDLFKAQLAQGLLESHGIEAMLMNTNFSMFNPIFKKSIDGIQMYVFEKDYAQAKVLLESEPLEIDENEILEIDE
ncbi:MAG: DUF2007 domain-containing protein [Bacteroidota bacterium]